MGGDWHQATGMEDIRRCECLSVPFRVGCLLIFFAQDQLMTRAPTCQRCQSLRHECYGLPDRVCGRCQRDKKTCQDVVFVGKSPSHFLGYLWADMVVVDSLPAARHWVRLNIAPVKPLTQPKRAASKGKVTSRPTTRPCLRKVTRVTSPTPEVADVEVLLPTIAGPSRAGHSPLFVDSVGSGDDHIEKGAPASSGE